MKKDYRITHWCGVPQKFLSEERLKEAIDAGFNLLSGEYKDVKTNLWVLDICQKYGVKLTVQDSRINQLLKEPELAQTLIPQICADYREHPALYGYHIVDEPNAADFPFLGEVVRQFKECDPDHIAYINLFPNYANAEQLGSPTYDDHLRAYMDMVNPELLSYDHYHLMKEEPEEAETVVIEDAREAGIFAAAQKRTKRAGFYDNIEAIRRFGLEYHVPYMLIILVTEHGPYRYLTREEISFEAYQTLAYGCSTLSYFTYWTPEDDPFWHWKNGMINADGTRCQHYEDIQSINAEILPIGQRIADTVSTAVFCVGEEEERVQPFAGHAGISSIEGGRFTVGFFADGTLLIANKDFADSRVCTITTDKALLRWDAATEDFVPCESLCMPIPAGGGLFLKIAE